MRTPPITTFTVQSVENDYQVTSPQPVVAQNLSSHLSIECLIFTDLVSLLVDLQKDDTPESITNTDSTSRMNYCYMEEPTKSVTENFVSSSIVNIFKRNITPFANRVIEKGLSVVPTAKKNLKEDR